MKLQEYKSQFERELKEEISVHTNTSDVNTLIKTIKHMLDSSPESYTENATMEDYVEGIAVDLGYAIRKVFNDSNISKYYNVFIKTVNKEWKHFR